MVLHTVCSRTIVLKAVVYVDNIAVLHVWKMEMCMATRNCALIPCPIPFPLKYLVCFDFEGTGESGKSTVAKQFKMIHVENSFDDK